MQLAGCRREDKMLQVEEGIWNHPFFPHGWATACSAPCQACCTAFTAIAPEMSKSPLSPLAQTFPREHKPAHRVTDQRLSCPSIPSAMNILGQMPEDVHTQQVNYSFSSLPTSGRWHPKGEVILQSTLSISLALLTHFERHCRHWKGSELFPSREGSAALTVTAQGHLCQGEISTISYWSGTALCFGLPVSQLKNCGHYKNQKVNQ